MSADFTPEKEDLKILTPFKMQVLTNFPYIEADFDALTNYQLLCKVVEYLNNVIAESNEVTEQVLSLYNAYVALQNYVNTYFDNLDISEEVDRKIDEMAEDGSLTNLIKEYVDPIYEAYETSINTTVETIDTKATNALNSVNTFTNTFSGLLDQEAGARAAADASLQTEISTIVASAGTAGESSSEIVAARTNTKSIAFPTLDDRINYIENTIPFGYQAINNGDYNNILTPGWYMVYGTATNAPMNIKGKSFDTVTCFLKVEGLDPDRNASTGEINHYRAIIQTLYPNYSTPLYYNGSFKRNIIWHTGTSSYQYQQWNIIPGNFLNQIFEWDNKLRRYSLSNYFASNGQVSTATNLNTVLTEGNYILTNENNTNIPSNFSVGILTVESNEIYAGGNVWIVQTFCPIDGSEVWRRTILSRDNPVIYDWRKIYPNATTLQLTGKKIVNFGDSIFGNTQGANSVSKSIADITDATVYNVGFGGCQMSNRTDSGGWNAFSMCNIADSIANNDFSMQDNAIADTSWSDKPYYFDNSEALLKSIDYSTVDYATIAYGTNDYTAGDSLDNPNNPKDVSTFGGALRYSIEAIQGAYPNIRIILGSPCFRLWNEGGTIITSDTKEYAGGYNLIEMTEKVKEIAEEYHLPFVNAYNNLGINKYNYSAFFDGTDLTHPNAYGNKLLGRLYGIKILGSE